MDVVVCHNSAVFTIGDVLRKLREDRGLTIEALAAEARVNKGTISAIENNEGNPRIATLRRITGALGSDVSDVFAAAGRSMTSDPSRHTPSALAAAQQASRSAVGIVDRCPFGDVHWRGFHDHRGCKGDGTEQHVVAILVETHSDV